MNKLVEKPIPDCWALEPKYKKNNRKIHYAILTNKSEKK